MCTRNIYLYVNNIGDEKKAKKLDSTSIAICFSFMLTETNLHNKIFAHTHYYCFRCQKRKKKDLLKEILIEKNEQGYLFIINVSNFNDWNDIAIFKKLLLIEKL